MTKLKELEKRLRDEPDNLGLRVMLAGALHEAGRLADAVELYRSVAIVYREQGRLQQASTVCRRILEIAPDDVSSQALLAMMTASEPPPPQYPAGATTASPLQYPAGATTAVPSQLSRAQLPPSLQRELDGIPQLSGIANAARQISESLIAANRQRDEAAERALFGAGGRLPSVPDGDDEPTLSPAGRGGRASFGDDDLTLPPGSRGRHASIGDDDLTLPPMRGRHVSVGDDDETAPHELPPHLGRGRRDTTND